MQANLLGVVALLPGRSRRVHLHHSHETNTNREPPRWAFRRYKPCANPTIISSWYDHSYFVFVWLTALCTQIPLNIRLDTTRSVLACSSFRAWRTCRTVFKLSFLDAGLFKTDAGPNCVSLVYLVQELYSNLERNICQTFFRQEIHCLC